MKLARILAVLSIAFEFTGTGVFSAAAGDGVVLLPQATGAATANDDNASDTNTGDATIGTGNIGDANTGTGNIGDSNTDHMNSGDINTGTANTAD